MILLHFLVMAIAALLDRIFQAELRSERQNPVRITLSGDGFRGPRHRT
ncbi:MAG TPA: hypothetical protein VLT36_03890 [Candidatus Dormibacteraeota bacterium]|nr:hypothetical protein [Candidatus Dormibacteraeota bacterium]